MNNNVTDIGVRLQRSRSKQHTPTPLGNLLNKYNISLSQLEHLCRDETDLNSRTTLNRLVRGRAGKRYVHELSEAVAKSVQKYLVEIGIDKATIDADLLSAFPEGEYQPMISKRIALSPKLCKHFGLKNAEGKYIDPFAGTPESREEVFISDELREVIHRLEDAIRYQGFVAVIGEIGSGKTTLRALFEDEVEGRDDMKLVWPEFFDMRNVSPMQIAESILEEFGVVAPPRSSVRRGRTVKDVLARAYDEGQRVALCFDEGHRLADPAISSLKNFLEMSSGGFKKYLGVIIFAQPVFKTRLADPRFREIHERIVTIDMPDIRKAAREYLAHRLKLAGRKLDDLFDAEAVKLITAQATTPLQLGNIANRALTISAEKFKNEKVIGAAIATEMFFENKREPGFKKRAA